MNKDLKNRNLFIKLDISKRTRILEKYSPVLYRCICALICDVASYKKNLVNNGILCFEKRHVRVLGHSYNNMPLKS